MLAVTDLIALDNLVAIRNVLVSVSDKDHLAGLLRVLGTANHTVRLFATGGTLKVLRSLRQSLSLDLAITPIEDYTGFPEMPGGLVKTLHPLIHGGLLAEPGDGDQRLYCERLGIETFDLAVVNLYPFANAVRSPGTTLETARRHIDIGGPTILRAAAKNFLRVGVVVDPTDYAVIAAELADQHGCLTLETRWRLACKAFQHVAAYDAAISDHLATLSWRDVCDAYDVR